MIQSCGVFIPFQFTKPRFGGAHVAAAKPNLSPKSIAVTDSAEASSSSAANIAVSAPDPQTAAQVAVPGPAAVCASVSTADPRTDTPEAPATPQLPRLWSEGLPTADHKWIAKTLLKVGPKGKMELQQNLKLWYYPPEPSQLYHQAPAPDSFFAHPLLQLTGAGLHKRARRVLDMDRIYNMVTETLTCTKCRANHVSWSQTVLTQLDLAHRSEFRVILTQKFACDIWVIRLLRERGLTVPQDS
ncbi:uncharacterized protein [Paralichthys olivaceus]|uniref:uncharacterized protein n=1 Tax=Paralichthys olivaceus TaxID=8255 RepID=UPI003751950A